MKKIIIIFLCVVLIGLGLFSLENKKGPRTIGSIKIGVVLPLSGGGLTPYGESLLKAINLAIENSGNKEKVILVVEDDHGCQTKDDVSSTQKLISVDKVQILIGAMCTSPTLAMAPIAEANKVVIISPSASGKNVTQAGEYIFRVYSSDAAKSLEIARFTFSKGYRKAAFLHDSSQDASVSQRDDTKEEFIKLGGRVIADESFVAKDKDMRTQLNKIKSTGAEIIFIGGLPDEIVLLLKQIKELGITSAVASTEGSIDLAMIALAGPGAEGLMLPTSVTPINKEVKSFAEMYKAKYNAEPTQFAAEAYDATLLAVSSGLSSDGGGPSIKSRLEKIGQKYQGASGEISFDKNGDVQKPIIMKKVNGGKLVETK